MLPRQAAPCESSHVRWTRGCGHRRCWRRGLACGAGGPVRSERAALLPRLPRRRAAQRREPTEGARLLPSRLLGAPADQQTSRADSRQTVGSWSTHTLALASHMHPRAPQMHARALHMCSRALHMHSRTPITHVRVGWRRAE